MRTALNPVLRILNIVFLFHFIFFNSQGKTILQPDYVMGNISLAVDKIELADSVAVVDLSFYGLPGENIRLISDTQLVGASTKKQYKILGSNDFELDKWIPFPESGYLSAQIYFEPIDENDKTIHFIEPKGWFVMGLNLEDSTEDKIKTHISGDVEIPAVSWLLIE